jgi:hypothetical protein
MLAFSFLYCAFVRLLYRGLLPNNNLIVKVLHGKLESLRKHTAILAGEDQLALFGLATCIGLLVPRVATDVSLKTLAFFSGLFVFISFLALHEQHIHLP